MPNEYLVTEMQLIDKSSDLSLLCGLTRKNQNQNEAQICAVPTDATTKTLVFKENPKSTSTFPVLEKDDPEIKPDPIATPKRGYTGKYFDLALLM